MGMTQTVLGLLVEDPDGNEVEHVVKIRQVDKHKAEVEAGRFSLTLGDNPLTIMSLWGWAALTRTGDTKLGWKHFEKALLEVEVDPEGDGDVEVPPTRPEATTS